MAAPNNKSPTPHSVKRCVLNSSQRSIANEQISLLALAEIPWAMFFYGMVAYISPWPWVTLIGLLAAPILLLRSEVSKNHGLIMLTEYMGKDLRPLGRATKGILIILAISAIAFVNSVLIRRCPCEEVILQVLFVLSMILVDTLVLGILIIITSAVRRDIPGEVWKAIANRLFHYSSRHRALADQAATEFAIAHLMLGFALRVVLIRAWAAVCHPLEGLAQLPKNWRETMMLIDLCHLPELLPVGNRFRRLTVKGLLEWKDEYYKNKYPETFNVWVLIALIYIPAQLYRWNLKASAWLWWPLALVVVPPFDGKTEEVKKYRTNVTTKGYWANKREIFVIAITLWLSSPLFPAAVTRSLSSTADVGAVLAFSTSFSPPPVSSLRYWLLWLCIIFAFWLHKRSVDFRAACAEASGWSKDYEGDVHRIERVRQALSALMILTGWSIGLWWAQQRWPSLFQNVIWNWLQPLL